MENPRYVHDCEQCKFLGLYEEYDLYFCDQNKFGPTVVARYGDEGDEYTSGLHMHTQALIEAEVRALDRMFSF